MHAMDQKGEQYKRTPRIKTIRKIKERVMILISHIQTRRFGQTYHGCGYTLVYKASQNWRES